MKRCPITYDVISDSENYSKRGLHLLSSQLTDLLPLAYSAKEQREEALARAGKMSVQGVQLKLSAQLKVKQNAFELVEQYGHYILKPQSEYYPELPENEALTMSLASLVGLSAPVHGLVYSEDGTMTYFVKRFDRVGHNKKIAMEDFSQLLQESRDTKYNSSMEKVCSVITQEKMCSFPIVEAAKFFKLTLFNYLVGNEDMHLKNFSLITRGNITMLAPGYDLLNSTIAQKNAREELALPLNGKKKNLTRKDLVNYLGKERLCLNERVIFSILEEVREALPSWKELIEKSFLSEKMKERYWELVQYRSKKIDL